MKKTILIMTLMMPGLAFGFWGKGKKGGKRNMDPAKKVEMLSKRLDLTDAQKSQVLVIQTEAKAKNQALRENGVKKLKGEMKQMLKANASADDLRAKHKEIETAQSKLRDNRFETMLKIRALLTDEQKKKFSKMRQKFEKKFKNKRGKRN